MTTPEICPLRFTLSSTEGWVSESNLPEECLKCLDRSMDSGDAIVSDRYMYDKAVEFVTKSIVGFDPDSADTWTSTMIYAPDDTDFREAEIATGFDMNSQSNIDGTETHVESVLFVCDI